jgi:hypothetical protein
VVGEASEVVLHGEGRVRGVPQQVEEEEKTSTTCSMRLGLGSSVVSVG